MKTKFTKTVQIAFEDFNINVHCSLSKNIRKKGNLSACVCMKTNANKRTQLHLALLFSSPVLAKPSQK